jgi:hypothetical protein
VAWYLTHEANKKAFSLTNLKITAPIVILFSLFITGRQLETNIEKDFVSSGLLK